MSLLDRLRRATGTDDVAGAVARAESEADRLARDVDGEARTHPRYGDGLAHIGELERHLHEIRDDIATVDRHVQIGTVMDWVARVQLRSSPLVSVVLPTRDRAALLPRAVGSVLAQTYPNWELLVVDDASTDDTPTVLAALDDPRIRVLSGTGRGASAARNVALDAAAGELVAYLDDDNRMHPDWLRAVVWAFEQQPATEVVYGAIVIDDLARARGQGGPALPRIGLHRFERAALEHHNLADMGTIAHRRNPSGPRFDETVSGVEDWDLLLQLTGATDALTLPAVALYYESTAPGRLSQHPDVDGEIELVRSKHR